LKVMNVIIRKFFFSSLLILFIGQSFGAILPHQGRVLVSGLPFDGIGKFRFALIDHSGRIRWNHEGGLSFPQSELMIDVDRGFYQCKLGDITIPGMAELPDYLFLFDDPLSLRIWFNDDQNETGLEQLGSDQPLLVAPYALATPWTNTDEIASLLTTELEQRANESSMTSTQLIENMVLLGKNSSGDGNVTLSMLPQVVQDDLTRIITKEMLDTNLSLEIDELINFNRLDSDILDKFSDIDFNFTFLTDRKTAWAMLDDNLALDINASISLDRLDTDVLDRFSEIDSNLSILKVRKITWEMLDDSLVLDLNASIPLARLDTDVLDRFSAIDSNLSFLHDKKVSWSMLDANLSYDLNASISLERFDTDVLDRFSAIDSNLSFLDGKKVSWSMLDANLSYDLNASISLERFDTDVLDRFSAIDANLSYLDARPVSWDMLDANLSNDLNASISLEHLDTDVLDRFSAIDSNLSFLDGKKVSWSMLDANLSYDLNKSRQIQTDDISDGNITLNKLSSTLIEFLKPAVSNLQFPTGFGGILFEGQTIVLTAFAEGRNLTYQWQKDGVDLAQQTGPNLKIENANPTNDDGNYSVLVSNIFGDVNSTTLEIKVSDTTSVSQGESFLIESAANMELLWVEPGTFTMGSPTTETGRDATDEPENEVEITRGFFLGKYEVTQAEYFAVLASAPSAFAGSRQPVESVNWDTINNFFLPSLNDLEKKIGRLPDNWEYTLPTEAEWEYACRAGTTTAYSWGDSVDVSNANFADSNLSKTVLVGSYAANPWGFHDMSGNVAEWVSDWYSAAYYGTVSTDPTGPATGTWRVYKGGGWDHISEKLRSAFKFAAGEPTSSEKLGFRLALKRIN
jgi:formylglycine-generating enzyme required for sulfatase activity